MSDLQHLRLTQIRTNGATQMRAALNRETVVEYADAMRRSETFPPVVVFYDGSDYWLGDGFHRVEAAQQAHGSAYQIAAEVRSGTRRDAVLHAAGANADHGLRRTNADKRRSVEALLRDDEWGAWSDREISRRCAVTQPFVSSIRKELTENGYQIPTERNVQRNGQTYTMQTTNIAAANQQRQTVAPPPATQPTTSYQSTVAEATILESHTNLIRRSLVATDDDRIRWQQLASTGATDEEITDTLLKVVPHTGGNDNQHWIRYNTFPERHACALIIYRQRSDPAPIFQMSTLDLVTEARRAWGIEKRHSSSKPVETPQPRPLTDDEAIAVVWRAIKHNCVTRASTPAAIAEERRLWLIRAPYSAFRDIINPGVTLPDATLSRAIATVAEELAASASTPAAQPEPIAPYAERMAAIPSHSSSPSQPTPVEPAEADPIEDLKRSPSRSYPSRSLP